MSMGRFISFRWHFIFMSLKALRLIFDFLWTHKHFFLSSLTICMVKNFEPVFVVVIGRVISALAKHKQMNSPNKITATVEP